MCCEEGCKQSNGGFKRGLIKLHKLLVLSNQVNLCVVYEILGLSFSSMRNCCADMPICRAAELDIQDSACSRMSLEVMKNIELVGFLKSRCKNLFP